MPAGNPSTRPRTLEDAGHVHQTETVDGRTPATAGCSRAMPDEGVRTWSISHRGRLSALRQENLGWPHAHRLILAVCPQSHQEFH